MNASSAVARSIRLAGINLCGGNRPTGEGSGPGRDDEARQHSSYSRNCTNSTSSCRAGLAR